MGRGQTRGGNRGRARGGSRGGSSRGGGFRGRGRGGSRNGRVGGKVDSKLDGWKTAEDMPMDEEDEFFAARDKILLDDTARARARAGPGMGDGDEFDQDDEVFGLDGVGGSSSEDEDDDEDEDEDEESENEAPAPTKPKQKAKQAPKDDDSDASSDSEEELSRWGKSRSAYYADNSRVMDEDDAEAREMEEREGRRLQAKLVAEIGEDDWGFNDTHDVDETVDSLSAVPVALPLPTDKASLLRHLEKHDPLALALARDWEDTAYQVMETTAAVKEIGLTNPDDPSLGLMHLHHQTLLSYAATLAFYLHLQSTPSGTDDPDTSSSPPPPTPTEAKRLRTEVVSRLLTLKQSLATLEDLGFAVDGEGEAEDEDDDDDDLSDDEDDFSVDGDVSFQVNGDADSEDSDDDVSPYGLKPGEEVSHASGGAPRLQNLEEEWQQDKLAGWINSSEGADKGKKKKKKQKNDSELGDLEAGELEALMQDALELEEQAPSSPKKRGKKTEPEEKEVKKDKKKKKKETAAPEGPVFDLVEPDFAPTKKSKRASTSTDVESEAFGDPTQLSHTDASDKEGRRRTLRFHTSKIESASNRRSAARAGMGGDDDLPYRDRRKEQKRKGLGEGGDDLDMDVDMDRDVGVDADAPLTGKRTRDSASPIGDGEDEGEDGYYDLVRQAKKQRKDEKKADYDAARASERIDPDDESASGPRSLTRAILKNRGMTPNRSPKNKAARNPRVKKKIQYAKAQKKLGSRQAMFKGGAEVAAAREGKYEGEKSGISGRVVKSVKL